MGAVYLVFDRGMAKKIEIQDAPGDLLELARQDTYNPPLGRITITSVETKTEGFYVRYINSLDEQTAIGWTRTKLVSC